MKSIIKWALNHIPRSVLQHAAGWIVPAAGLFYRGRGRQCPICGSKYRKFMPYGYVQSRPDALCPHCLSLERHRLLWLYLTRETDLLEQFPQTLHIAPEVCLMRHLRKHFAARPERYVTADLESPLAELHFDVQQIPLADGSVDVVLCNHILEHVADDRQAMRELHRILRPGGGLGSRPLAGRPRSGGDVRRRLDHRPRPADPHLRTIRPSPHLRPRLRRPPGRSGIPGRRDRLRIPAPGRRAATLCAADGPALHRTQIA